MNRIALSLSLLGLVIASFTAGRRLERSRNPIERCMEAVFEAETLWDEKHHPKMFQADLDQTNRRIALFHCDRDRAFALD